MWAGAFSVFIFILCSVPLFYILCVIFFYESPGVRTVPGPEQAPDECLAGAWRGQPPASWPGGPESREGSFAQA